MGRPVQVNELGLVIPPSPHDCLGEACPVAAKIGHCFVDEHHLYFPFAKFQFSELTAEFQNDPFNKVRLPRCHHNSAAVVAIHSQHSEALIPSVSVMERFLEEAALLRQLGVLSVKSDGLLSSLEQAAIPIQTIRRREDSWFETQQAYEDLTRRAKDECEVILPFLSQRRQGLPKYLGAVLLNAA